MKERKNTKNTKNTSITKRTSVPAKRAKSPAKRSNTLDSVSQEEIKTIEVTAQTEELEGQGLNLDTRLLKKLDHDELKEVYQVFSDVDDEVSQEEVAKVIRQVRVPPIEKAKLGHRVWSYFYEKWVARIAFIIWFLLQDTLKQIFSQQIPLPSKVDLSDMPGFLRKFLFSETGEGLILGGVIFILGFIAIWILWRIWLSFLESRRNGNHPGSSFFRRALGIVVVNKKGQPVGWLRAFLRSFFRIPVFSFFTLATMEFSKNNRGLHDLIFRTYVLRINEDVSPQAIASFIKENY